MRQVEQVNIFEPMYDHGSMRPGYRWRGAKIGRQLKAKRLGGTIYDLLTEDDRTYPYHVHHGVEEWLIVLDGSPTMRHAGLERVLNPGDVICFQPGLQGAHQVRGPGTVLILSSEVRGPQTSEYPDSGKVGVSHPRAIFRAEDGDVDYWEGEEVEVQEPEEGVPAP
jgi:uncharacterized cupin superfamily protein